MGCTQLFVAAFAICLGWQYAKIFSEFIRDIKRQPGQSLKSYIFSWIPLFVATLYFGWLISSTSLPL